MSYWKTEYAVASTADDDEFEWHDDREAAVASAKAHASKADGHGYQIIEITRNVDDRDPAETYVFADGKIQVLAEDA